MDYGLVLCALGRVRKYLVIFAVVAVLLAGGGWYIAHAGGVIIPEVGSYGDSAPVRIPKPAGWGAPIFRRW